MGQKIHPLGFRVGITKKHQSVWFARFQKHQYAQSVLEDKFLRQNLSKILKELFEKKFKNSENMPKISHIQIVRGLIPYEIGIQIHAENCQVIKSAFENFEVQPEILHNLLKNHVLLEKTGKNGKVQSFLNDSSSSGKNIEEHLNSQNESKSTNSEKTSSLSSKKQRGPAETFSNKKKAFASFRQRFLGKFIILKNKKKISKKYDPNARVFFKNNLRSFLKKNIQEKRNSRFSSRSNQTRGSFGNSQKNKKKNQSSPFRSVKNLGMRENLSNKQKAFFDYLQLSHQKSNSLPGRSPGAKSCSKFVNFYMSQTNLSFFNALKTEMLFWNEYFQKSKNSQIQKFGHFHYVPFGSQKKWSFERFQRFEKLSIPVLTKLLKSLQQRAFKKMERLRKEYLVFGKFSKTKTFSYFQRIRFLQSFKKYIALRKTNQSFTSRGKEPTSLERQKFASKVVALTEKAIQKRYQNFASSADFGAEKNTMKFLDSLQSMVQHHRSKNLFLYLSTISDARKHLRKIQKFTKQQADFLFGLSLKNIQGFSAEEQQQIVKNQVAKTFFSLSQKSSYQQGVDQNKNYHDVFVEQLQKQRKICQQNIQLMPKISLQFYSVKPQNFKTRASSVADAIVDDLEKRKAFRRVIKKAKEDLMKTPKVKGVKIQVSGRLNGAEIARSEWVRAGRVPLQTLRANIDYCYKTAQTMYGIIGVKVWIYKGYTKMRKPTAKAPTLISDLL
jgi:ribosomal protein S3